MAPKHPIAVTPAATLAIVPLTEDEHKMLVIAIRLDAALHYYELSGDSVDMAWFLQAICDELGNVEVIYSSCTHGAAPCIHPLLDIFTETWERAIRESCTPNLRDIRRNDITAQSPHPPVFTPAPVPTSTPMENPIPASTPVPAPTPRPVPTPTAVPPTATRTSAHVGACMALAERQTSAPTPSASTTIQRTAESLAECAPTTPEAEDSDSDEEMDGGKTPRKSTKAGKWPMVMLPGSNDPIPQCAHVEDPKACGLCKDANKTCRPQRGCKTALACRECTRLKVACDPLAGWAEVLLAKQKVNAKPKRRTLVEYEDIPPALDNIKMDIQNDIAQLHADIQRGLQEIVDLHTEFCHDIVQLCDHVYNQDKMLRLLCSQSNVNLSAAGLHIPSAPTFYQSASATLSTASIASTVSSTSSNLGISDLTIASTSVMNGTCAQMKPSAQPSAGSTLTEQGLSLNREQP
ncbi:hypothetical protein EI94DRAFT_1800143 [Lactarius quietus]|nr:hypothetical protein EI94DRAFT_1800143 [Lactarius quietus]